MAKMAVFELLESTKLISRKIWVIEKSWNFHTVVDKSNVFEWCLIYWYFYSDPNLNSPFQNCKAKIILLNNFVSQEIHIWSKFDFFQKDCLNLGHCSQVLSLFHFLDNWVLLVPLSNSINYFFLLRLLPPNALRLTS